MCTSLLPRPTHPQAGLLACNAYTVALHMRKRREPGRIEAGPQSSPRRCFLAARCSALPFSTYRFLRSSLHRQARGRRLH
jgi:hypothetical protein